LDNIKIIWGTDHKVGTTMIAQSYTEVIAGDKENVLLLTLSTNPGDDFYDEEALSIEALKSRLSCGLITKDNIKKYALKGKDFYKLNGLSKTKNMYGFTLTMAVDLIQVSIEAFDEVVIDCGTDLDNPLALAALSFERNNVFVFSQQESSIRSWEAISEEMSALRIVPDIAVINNYYKADNYTVGYISQRTGIPQNIFKTVKESEFGIQAEADRKTLLFYGDKQYEKDIRNLIN